LLVLDGGGGGGGGITTEEPLVDGLGEFVGAGVVDAGVVVGFGVGEGAELFVGVAFVVGGVGTVGVGVETVLGFVVEEGDAVGVGVGTIAGEFVELEGGGVGEGIGETGSGTNGDRTLGVVCCADVEETIINQTIAVTDSKPFTPPKTDLWLITFTLSPFPFPLYLHPPATEESRSHPIAAEPSPERTLDRLHT
jgi:hypothetical protein